MFAFLFSSVLSVTAFAQAAPQVPGIHGHYLIRGHYEITTHIRTEVVRGQSSSSQARIGELRSDGYTCSVGSQLTWRCQRFLHDEPPFPQMDQYVRDHWQSHAFIFEEAAAVEQTNDSSYLKEYTAWQKAKHVLPNGHVDGEWSSVDFDWVQGLWKVYLGSTLDEKYFYFIWSDDSLIKPDVVTFQNGTIEDRYMIDIELELARPCPNH